MSYMVTQLPVWHKIIMNNNNINIVGISQWTMVTEHILGLNFRIITRHRPNTVNKHYTVVLKPPKKSWWLSLPDPPKWPWPLFLGRLLRVYLRKPVSTHLSTKSFPDLNEIWCVTRGRWVMHDVMPYDPIQGQGHDTLKVRNSSIFNNYNYNYIAFH